MKITSQIKRSLLSLFFPAGPSRNTRQRGRSKPATSITRIQSGMPQARAMPANAMHTRRGRRPPVTYTRGGYLSNPRRDARVRQPIFRIV